MDEIPEYGGQSTWPSVIAMIGPKACLDLQIRVCDKEKVSFSEQNFGLWHNKDPIWKKPKPKNFAKNTHYLQVKTINYKEKKTIVIIVCKLYMWLGFSSIHCLSTVDSSKTDY